MSNGRNTWGVSYSGIAWLEDRVLRPHRNVRDFQRREDIVFNIERRKGKNLVLLCLNEYVFGLTAAYRALSEFPNVDVIYIGGKWNKCTSEAHEYCSEQGVEVINTSELNRVLSSAT